MKALTLTQPWASLVAARVKFLETRDWGINYKGRIAIHAAKSFPTWARETCLEEPFRSTLARLGFRTLGHLPLGMIVATADLTHCYRMPERPKHPIPDDQLPWGDFRPGRWVWVLQRIEALPVLVEARGQLGLWEWREPPAASGQASIIVCRR